MLRARRLTVSALRRRSRRAVVIAPHRRPPDRLVIAPPMCTTTPSSRAFQVLAVLGLAASLAAPAASQEPSPGSESVDGPLSRAYFFGDRPGLDQYVGPFDVLLNKGFNLAQAVNRDRAIFSADYGWAHVRGSVLHPARAIEQDGGWGAWIEEQILPIQAVHWIRSGFDWGAADNMTWFPNYFGHFVEGGITHRRLAEKLRSQGVPAATMLAAVTTMGASVLNEAYTHPTLTEGTGGTVADLYLFDLGGVIAFSFDPVARFFARTLRAHVWPSQAALSLSSGELVNNANNLIFKIPLPRVDRVSVFVRTAVGSHVGATLHLADGLDVSMGVGADTERQNIDPVTGEESVDLRLSSSLYLDRGGSVLASVYWSQVDHRRLSVNVYPGVLHEDFGAWLALARGGSMELGLTHRRALGVGLGAGW